MIACILSLSLAVADAVGGVSPAAVANLSSLEGTAWRVSAGAAPRALKVKDVLRAGDTLRVDDKSRVELRLPDRSVVRVGPRSELALADLMADGAEDGAGPNMKLALGKLWAHVVSMKKTGGMRVSAGGSVIGVRGTTFAVESGVSGTQVRLYEGSLSVWRPGGGTEKELSSGGLRPKEAAPPHREVAPHDWARDLAAGEFLRISADGKPEESGKINPADPEEQSEWARWNRERDAAQAGQPR